jgi:hypothetical protein
MEIVNDASGLRHCCHRLLSAQAEMRRQSHSSRSTSRRSFSTKSTTAPRRASPQVGNVPPGVLYAGRFDSTPKGNGAA